MENTNLKDCFLEFGRLREKIRNNESIENILLPYPITLLPPLPEILSRRYLIHPDVWSQIPKIKPAGNRSDTEFFEIEELKPEFREADLLFNTVNQMSLEYGGQALKYVLYELGGNIFNHSGFSKAYVMIRKFQNQSHPFLEVCFYDDGISIPQSLKKYDFVFENQKDSVLILKAINGMSSKKMFYEEGSRGHGMNSSAQIIVNGFGGELFIASQKGAVFIEPNADPLLCECKEKYNISGTLIGLRNPKKQVNLYDYIDVYQHFKGKRGSSDEFY
ncbi:hypothetical protein [Methanolapillus ohkumae]|uniref:Uncharacterized protein n=1 Tax=Methanolapillus ohkumae TaxID=3028298 RepID=A0AA96V6Y5_9EURY|nr:hypothetical protein MsAm2_16180 [Methanosarcinaceae archaeon Am2]